MKWVVAYIKPHRLDRVVLALEAIEHLSGMSVCDVKGFGRRENDEQLPQDRVRDFAPYMRLEIFCQEEIVEEVVRTILHHAHTGLRGDGKIYVIPVQEAWRIRTQERGPEVV